MLRFVHISIIALKYSKGKSVGQSHLAMYDGAAG
jgi:hypothetical protein